MELESHQSQIIFIYLVCFPETYAQNFPASDICVEQYCIPLKIAATSYHQLKCLPEQLTHYHRPKTQLFIPRNLDSAATDKPDITEIKNSIRVSRLSDCFCDSVGSLWLVTQSSWPCWYLLKDCVISDEASSLSQGSRGGLGGFALAITNWQYNEPRWSLY